MKEIKMENGFSCTIDETALDDMEFVDLLADCEENPHHIGKLVEKLFGKENKRALYDHLRKDGRVPISAVNEAVEKAFNALGEEAKN